MAQSTNKSTKVCVWACRAEISSTITVANTASANTVFNTAIPLINTAKSVCLVCF